jgi:hypothetical protein
MACWKASFQDALNLETNTINNTELLNLTDCWSELLIVLVSKFNASYASALSGACVTTAGSPDIVTRTEVYR